MASSLPAKATWRPDIEGLRGLAVLLVVCFHAGLPMLRGAFVAVDVFFVLSGFFLTSTLVRQLVSDDELELEEVYARRVWRLLPAMVVVLLATLLSAMFLYAPIDRAARGGQPATGRVLRRQSQVCQRGRELLLRRPESTAAYVDARR